VFERPLNIVIFNIFDLKIILYVSHIRFFLEDFSIKLILYKPKEQKIVENHGLVSMLKVGLKTGDLVREISRIGTLH